MESVFEVIYDYGDGYFTVFMTQNKDFAYRFIETVRAHDSDFISRYGVYEDCDERISEVYEETHPLKGESCQVFGHTYESSLLEYVGETHADAMSVIEHKLRSEYEN